MVEIVGDLATEFAALQTDIDKLLAERQGWLKEIERLRAQKSKMICEGCRRLAEVVEENEKLEAENEQMRAVLKAIVAEGEEVEYGPSPAVSEEALEAARKALLPHD